MITRTRGHDVEMRAFALTDMVKWGYSGLRNIKPRVGEKQARGIPALHAAARLRATQIAQLDLYCWRGDGPTRERIDTVWQARLFKNGPQPSATNPVQSRYTFWETVEESMAWRNNAFIWKNVDPSSGRIVDWWALHPDQVTPKFATDGSIKYTVEVSPGYVDPVGRGKGKYDVDASTILHIRGHGEGGQLVAPTPIEVFRQALEGPIGRQRHEARMWRRGTALQVAIEFPAGVGKEQADQWREVWRSNYEGTDGETTAVIGGGGVIKPIGMTMNDAQFADMYDLTTKDAAQIMQVPANLLGVQVTKVRSNLEEDLMAWLRFGLGPELARIEDALYADPELFGGSQTYPGFDTDGFVRGDLMTEATILQAFVQAGVLTPNEARHKLGYERDTDPNSDTLQVTPVGGAENPGLSLKPDPQLNPDENARTREPDLTIPKIEINAPINLEPAVEKLARVMREGTDEQARVNASVLRAAADQRKAAEERIRQAETEREERRRDERAQEAAELRERDERLAAALERDIVIPAPIVHVAPPEVHVHNEPVPVQLSLELPEKKKSVNVKRGPGGFITGMTIEEEQA